MLSERTLARLAQLNRQPLTDVSPAVRTPAPASPASDSEAPAQLSLQDNDHATTDLRGVSQPTQLPLIGIRPCLEMGQTVDTPWGPYCLVRLPLDQVWPRSGECLRQLASTTPADWSGDAELQALQNHFPHETLLLDLETCGLSGSAIFLVGTICQIDGVWELRQLWARDYSEEKAILQETWRLCADRKLLVTFNGKTFDWPMVHDRSTLHHLGQRRDRRRSRSRATDSSGDTELPFDPAEPWTRNTPRPELVHCDLLRHARRRWRGQVPNYRLQTLERYLCGRQRTDDLPGSEIPAAYHDYVRKGQSDQVDAILHHNALDLITSAQLAFKLLAGANPAEQR
ncbi:MAG: ribonuclease H-like domain-containing protein [Pirellulales bacterium]